MAFTFAGRYAEALIDLSGDALAATPVRVYLKGTSTLATLYTDRAKSTAASNPVTTDSRGLLSFYADPAEYEGAAVVAAVEQARFPVVVGDDAAEIDTKVAIHAADTALHGGGTAGADLATHAALTTTAHGGLVASSDARLTDTRTPTDASVTDAKVAGGAAIALSKLATNPLDRAAHTGTQTAATVSDFNTAVRTNRLDQMAAPTVAVDMNARRLSGLAEPGSAQDAATKNYVDATAQGLDVKASVRLATAAALAAVTYDNGASGVGATLTATGNGALSVDGGGVGATNRILVKNQVAGLQNGIYTVTDAGSAGSPFVLTRATDADTNAEVSAGMFVFATEGIVNADSGWVLTTDTPIIGTTALTFSQFSSSGAFTAGAGLTKTGTTLDVGAGSGLAVTADTVGIAPGGVGTGELASGAVTDDKVAAANKDGTAATPSLRTLGTGATQAAVGSHGHLHSALTGIGVNDHHAQVHTDSDHSDGPNLKPTIVDAKGDLLVGTAADTIARLPLGSDNQILTADSAQTSGVKWATAPGAGAAGIPASLIDAKGDLIGASANDTAVRIPVGTDGQTLVADALQAAGLRWASIKPATTDGVRYVSKQGNDSNDGLSWASAKLTIQAGHDSLTGNTGVIYAGKGTYTETVTLSKENVRLIGAGKIFGSGTNIIAPNDTANCINITGIKNTVEHVGTKGFSSTWTGVGFNLDTAYYASVINCEHRNNDGWGTVSGGGTALKLDDFVEGAYIRSFHFQEVNLGIWMRTEANENIFEDITGASCYQDLLIEPFDPPGGVDALGNLDIWIRFKTVFGKTNPGYSVDIGGTYNPIYCGQHLFIGASFCENPTAPTPQVRVSSDANIFLNSTISPQATWQVTGKFNRFDKCKVINALNIIGDDNEVTQPWMTGGGVLTITGARCVLERPRIDSGSISYGTAVGPAYRAIGRVMATSDTSGFLRLPVMSGAPTGTPSAGNTGEGILVPHVYDAVNHKLWAHIGGTWRSSAAFTDPAVAGLTPPSSVAGLKLWLRADSLLGYNDGDKVPTWADASGNGYDVAQATAGNQPIYKTGILSGKPVLRFNGNTQYYERAFTADLVPAALTVIVVGVIRGGTGGFRAAVSMRNGTNVGYVMYATGSNTYQWWTGTGAAVSQLGTASVVIGTPVILEGLHAGAGGANAKKGYVSGTANGTATSALSQPVANPFRVGAGQNEGAPTLFWNGDIAEVLVYDSSLADGDRDALETYLGAKWGITVV